MYFKSDFKPESFTDLLVYHDQVNENNVVILLTTEEALDNFLGSQEKAIDGTFDTTPYTKTVSWMQD